jgi:serine/threonine protein kinase
MAYRPATAGTGRRGSAPKRSATAGRHRSRDNVRGGFPPPGGVSEPTSSHVGHYLIGKTLGQGTFGKVRRVAACNRPKRWRATELAQVKLGTHILTGEQVAIKVLEKARIKEIAGQWVPRSRSAWRSPEECRCHSSYEGD